MANASVYRWRKATDINREYALFELLDGDTPVLDVGFTDDGVLEVTFNHCIGGKMMEWDHLRALLDEGKGLTEQDR